MLPEPSSLPKAYPPPERYIPKNVRVPRRSSIGSPYASPPRSVPQPVRAREIPKTARPTPSIRRPGCVTATALFFFGASLLAALSFAGALVLADILGAIGNLGLAALLPFTAIGLWFMYRWAANLVIIICIVNMIRMLLFPVVLYLAMGDYFQDGFAKLIMVLVWGAMAAMVISMLGLVAYWFLRTRRYFEDNDIFPHWERRLYILAIVILVFEVIASYISLPSSF